MWIDIWMTVWLPSKLENTWENKWKILFYNIYINKIAFHFLCVLIKHSNLWYFCFTSSKAIRFSISNPKKQRIDQWNLILTDATYLHVKSQFQILFLLQGSYWAVYNNYIHTIMIYPLHINSCWDKYWGVSRIQNVSNRCKWKYAKRGWFCKNEFKLNQHFPIR